MSMEPERLGLLLLLILAGILAFVVLALLKREIQQSRGRRRIAYLVLLPLGLFMNLIATPLAAKVGTDAENLRLLILGASGLLCAAVFWWIARTESTTPR
jgi:hypothetical protein